MALKGLSRGCPRHNLVWINQRVSHCVTLLYLIFIQNCTFTQCFLWVVRVPGDTGLLLKIEKVDQPLAAMPEEPCEPFYRELQFVRNEDAILSKSVCLKDPLLFLFNSPLQGMGASPAPRVMPHYTCGCPFSDGVVPPSSGRHRRNPPWLTV